MNGIREAAGNVASSLEWRQQPATPQVEPMSLDVLQEGDFVTSDTLK